MNRAPSSPARLLVVVVNFRTAELTIDCLRSLEEEVRGLGDVHVVVTDNGSNDGSAERIADAIDREHWSDWAELLPLEHNRGYAAGNNAAIRPALERNPPDYVLLLNSDTLCIPKGAPRPDNAHKFINYLLDAKAGAEISKTILFPTPNAAAKALMPDDYKNNPVIFPPAEILSKCEYGAFEGAEKASLYEEVITRVRAA